MKNKNDFILRSSVLVLSIACLTLGAKHSYAIPAELTRLESGREKQIRELREQEIQQLRLTLGRRSPQNRKADLFLRLAELYLENYRDAFLLEGRAHEKRLESGVKNSKLDRSGSFSELRKAIQVAESILRDKLPTTQLDQVYYFLGYNYGELGDLNKSKNYFELLVQKFPNSKLKGEALRELGDYAYAERKFLDSEKYFSDSLKYLSGETIPRVYHKLGWTQYRLKKFEQAVESLKKAVSALGKSGEKLVNVREEVLRDLAVFMTESGQVEEAIQYFKQTAGDKNYFPRTLERLGKQYERSVEPKKATLVYETLLKTNPDDEAAFRVKVKIIDLDLRRQQHDEALKRLSVGKIHRTGESDTQVAYANLKAMIRRTATESHEVFRKKGTRSNLELSEKFYSAYIQYFIGVEDLKNELPEIQMYLAEVKRDLSKNKEASELYKKVVQSKDVRFQKEAALQWIGTLLASLPKDNKKLEKMSESESEFIEATGLLSEITQQGNDFPELKEIQLRAAQVLAGYSDTIPKALERLNFIIGRWSSSKQAIIAAKLVLQIYSDQKDYESLKREIARFKENSTLFTADQSFEKDKRLRTVIENLEAQLQIGKIASLEKEKNYLEAMEEYFGFAKNALRSNPKAVEKALINAIGSFVKASVEVENSQDRKKLWDENSVYPVLKFWLELSQKDKSKKLEFLKAYQFLGTSAFIQGEFYHSAKVFAALAEVVAYFGEKSREIEFTILSARIFEGVGQVLLAKNQYQKAIQLNNQLGPSAKQRNDTIYLSLAEISLGENLKSDADRFYKLCAEINSNTGMECQVRRAEMFLATEQKSEAEKILKTLASGSPSSKNKQNKKLVSQVESMFLTYGYFKLAQIAAESVSQDLTLKSFENNEKLAIRVQRFLKGFELKIKPYSDFLAKTSSLPNTIWKLAGQVEIAKLSLELAGQFEKEGVEGEADKLYIDQIVQGLRKKAFNLFENVSQSSFEMEQVGELLPYTQVMLSFLSSPKKLPIQVQKPQFRLAGETRSELIRNIQLSLYQDANNAQAWVNYGNILWSENKGKLSEVAYERALVIHPKNTSALNNLAILKMSGSELYDWVHIHTALSQLQKVQAIDSFHVISKMNRAYIYGYYSSFKLANNLVKQVNAQLKASKMETPPDWNAFVGGVSIGLNDVKDNFHKDHPYYESFFDAEVKDESSCLKFINRFQKNAKSRMELGFVQNVRENCSLWK